MLNCQRVNEELLNMSPLPPKNVGYANMVVRRSITYLASGMDGFHHPSEIVCFTKSPVGANNLANHGLNRGYHIHGNYKPTNITGAATLLARYPQHFFAMRCLWQHLFASGPGIISRIISLPNRCEQYWAYRCKRFTLW